MKNFILLLTFVGVLVGGGVFAMKAMLPGQKHDCAHCKANQSKCCIVKPGQASAHPASHNH